MVKCADCGFLAQHIFRGPIPQGFIDIEEQPRKTGVLPHAPFGFHAIGELDRTPEKLDGDNFPTCFVRSFDLGQEVNERIGHGDVLNAVKDIIQKERICDHFIKWERGFTPKEHREMMDRARLLKWQIDREDADKKWREDQDKRRSTDEWKRNVLIAGATIFAAVAGGIVGHFIG